MSRLVRDSVHRRLNQHDIVLDAIDPVARAHGCPPRDVLQLRRLPIMGVGEARDEVGQCLARSVP